MTGLYSYSRTLPPVTLMEPSVIKAETESPRRPRSPGKAMKMDNEQLPN